jgi:hypothetical protein
MMALMSETKDSKKTFSVFLDANCGCLCPAWEKARLSLPNDIENNPAGENAFAEVFIDEVTKWENAPKAGGTRERCWSEAMKAYKELRDQ